MRHAANRVRLFFSLLTTLLLLLPTALADVVPLPIDLSGGRAPLAEGYLSEYEYEDESIHVVVEKGYAYSTTYWTARVKIADASQLRTLAAGGFDSNRTTNSLALCKRVNAVLAVNGDYYCYINDGYLIRQGILYRDLPNPIRDTLLIDDKGDFHIVLNASAENIAAFSDHKIINSFNFGPALVVDGEPVTSFVEMGNNLLNKHQRCAIAQVGPLEYLVIVCEGPIDVDSTGMTLVDFASLVASLNVQQAYNLDGGNSCLIAFNGQKINARTNRNHRPLSDIIYFASAYEPATGADGADIPDDGADIPE